VLLALRKFLRYFCVVCLNAPQVDIQNISVIHNYYLPAPLTASQTLPLDALQQYFALTDNTQEFSQSPYAQNLPTRPSTASLESAAASPPRLPLQAIAIHAKPTSD
jgi:hypothetical protein